MKWFASIFDLSNEESVIAGRRYGIVQTSQGKFAGLHFRPWPKLVSAPDFQWLSGWQIGRQQKDQCLLYYNQPVAHSNFLALKYIVTSFGTSYPTLRRALQVLDEIARIKNSDAIVTEVFNDNISDRFLARMGWERHMPNSTNRHFIRRFYGEFPKSSLNCSEMNTHSSG